MSSSFIHFLLCSLLKQRCCDSLNRPSSLSSKMSDNIPLDIVTKILIRCDIPTILRCRCVSQSLRSRIDSNYFIELHADFSRNTNSNLIFYEERPTHFADNWFYPHRCTNIYGIEIPNELINCQHRSVSIIGSFNGLLCLWDSETGNLALVNPCTRNEYHLPGFFLTPKYIQEPDQDLHRFCRGYGLGFDREKDEYKAVFIFQRPFDVFLENFSDDFKKSEMYIGHVKTRAFKVVKKISYYVTERCPGVLAGGALHWLMSKVDDYRINRIIVRYDLGTDKIRKFPQPNILNNRYWHLGVGILESWLCISAIHKVDYKDIDFWVMKEYGVKESWTKLFSFPLTELPSINIPALTMSTIGTVIVPERDFRVILDQHCSSLVWCEKEDGSVWNYFSKANDAIVCLKSLVRVPLSESTDQEKYGSLGSKIEDGIQGLHL